MPKVYIDGVRPTADGLVSQSGAIRAREILPTAEAYSHKDESHNELHVGVLVIKGCIQIVSFKNGTFRHVILCT